VAVKIKLMRLGKIRAPYYRIVVADARTKRDGRAIEEIGKYHPTRDPSFIEVDSDRAQYWLSVGAQPTEPVMAILKVTGDWQKFKGLPGAEGTLRYPEAKADKKTLFEAAAKESGGDAAKDGATTPRKRAAKKAAAPAPAAEAPAAEAPAAEAPAAEAPAAEAPAAEAPAAEAPAAEAPAAEAPAAEAPAAEAPAAPALAAEAPAAEAPAAEAPAAEAPAVEAPAAETAPTTETTEAASPADATEAAADEAPAQGEA
jgi:small subunit ribosomal protein S16